MDVLILGASRVARRRVLPSLVGIPVVDRVHVASRSCAGANEWSSAGGEWFRDYETALRQMPPGSVVYVSLPNALHAEWCARALALGLHVLVDKPATTAYADAENLVSAARTAGCCIAEAVVWMYHPQVQAALEMFGDTGCQPGAAAAMFSFPPLSPGDFRYDRALGGGSLNDLGPYAVSCGRVFFGAEAVDAHCRVQTRREAVDTSCSVLMVYRGGGAISSHVGFTTEYTNMVRVVGAGVSLELARVFTPAPDLPTTIVRTRKGVTDSVAFGSANVFQLWLADVLGSIDARRDIAGFGETLLADARVMERLRCSVEEADA